MKRPVKICFLALESILYALFLAGDLLHAYDTLWLKFAAIAFVAAAGLLAGGGWQNRLTTAALCLTLAADIFLLALDAHYMLGVALFLTVQLLYTLRLAAVFGSMSGRAILVRLVPALAAAVVMARIDVRTALPAAYIVWFIVNLANSIRLAAIYPNRRNIYFAAGLLLFFCCDLCVGVHNLPGSLLPAQLVDFAEVAMWGFYLPGQVLILASTEALGGRQV